jgi:hypothetical protein
VDDPVVVWSIGTDGVVTFTIGDQVVAFAEAAGLEAFATSVEHARLCHSTFEVSGYEAAQRFADEYFGNAQLPDGDLASVLDHTGEGIQVVRLADLEHETPQQQKYRAIVDRLYETRLMNHLEVLQQLLESCGSEEAWLRVYEAAEREGVLIERD